MEKKTQDETRAPYAHLACSTSGIRRNIQNNMVFIAAILIIAKILHAAAVPLLGASDRPLAAVLH